MALDAQIPSQRATAEVASVADSSRGGAASLTIRVEWLAYFALALIALVLRVAMLETVPLSDYEARQALHAWHAVSPDAPGFYRISENPLTHLVQVLSFSMAGPSPFTARIAVAIGGVALSLTPLLFRDSLGVTRAFVWSALLAILTVPVTASRNADGTTFMMLFTALAIWMIRRYWYSHKLSDAMTASAFVSCMLLMSSPSGIPLFVILLVAGWLAVWRTAISAPQRLDLPGDDILQLSQSRMKTFPYMRVAIVPLAVVFTVGTVFMLYPAGLQSVGELFNAFFAGLTQSADPDGLRLGFIALLTYEPLLIVFALGGAWLLWKHGAISFIDRFAAAWAAIASIGLLLYPGALAAGAMWVVLPLSLLASYGITQLLINRRMVLLWEEETDEQDSGGHDLYSTRYWWVKWPISFGILLLLLTASVQFAQVARGLLELPSDAGLDHLIARLSENAYPRLAQGLGLLAMTGITGFVMTVLLSNKWGSGACLQGIGIGFLWFMIASSLGGVWNTAVLGADNPAELWRASAISEDAQLLRETLFDLADRESEGFAQTFELSIVIDGTGIVEGDGLLAWLVRDFPEARFLRSPEALAGQPVVIMSEGPQPEEVLKGQYVGQRFVLRRSYALGELDAWQWLAWWSQRRKLRTSWSEETAVILWLRQDVYDGHDGSMFEGAIAFEDV